MSAHDGRLRGLALVMVTAYGGCGAAASRSPGNR